MHENIAPHQLMPQEAADVNTSVLPPTEPRQQRVSSRNNSLAHVWHAPLDLSKSTSEGLRDGHGPNPSVLSPVYETRTPSPTANRRTDEAGGARVNGVKTRRVKSMEIQPPPTPATAATAFAHQMQTTSHGLNGHIEGSGPSASGSSNAIANGWKPAANKNKKNAKTVAKKGGPVPGPAKANGEPLPVDESERKGG